MKKDEKRFKVYKTPNGNYFLVLDKNAADFGSDDMFFPSFGDLMCEFLTKDGFRLKPVNPCETDIIVEEFSDFKEALRRYPEYAV